MRRVVKLGLCLLLVATACGGGEPVPDDALGVVEVGAGEEIQIRSLNAITGNVAFLGVAEPARCGVGDCGLRAGGGPVGVVGDGPGRSVFARRRPGFGAVDRGGSECRGRDRDVVFGCGGSGLASDIERGDGDDLPV